MSVRDERFSVKAVLALTRTKSRRWWGRHQLDHGYYTPLYEKGKKKTKNKSMETTLVIPT